MIGREPYVEDSRSGTGSSSVRGDSRADEDTRRRVALQPTITPQVDHAEPDLVVTVPLLKLVISQITT